MDLRWVVGLAVLGAMGVAAAAPEEPGLTRRLRCKVFATPLDAEVDTHEAGSDLGKWVMESEERGWRVANVTFDIGQKTTGFAQGWTQVCLEPR